MSRSDSIHPVSVAKVNDRDPQLRPKRSSQQQRWISDALARFALAALGRHAGRMRFVALNINAEPAVAVLVDDVLRSVIATRSDGAQICDVFAVLNPDKLRDIRLPAAAHPDETGPRNNRESS